MTGAARVTQAAVGIVGAGPGGMAAAVALARQGHDVVVLDEGQRAGGQIFRQPPEGFALADDAPAHRLEPPSHHHGHRLLHELDGTAVEVRTGCTVWDARAPSLGGAGRGAGGALFYERAGRSERLDCRAIVLAPGAYDRVVPFPGWTLPGVMTAGAAQVMVRGHLVAPGRRAVVAGSGPLLLPTVTSLLAAGVEVAAAVEASSRWRQARALKGVLTNGARFKEAWFYLRALLRHGIKLRTGWTVLAAHGDGRVERVTLGRVDAEGRPVGGATREVEADVVCTGFGLVPSIELGQLLGCRTCYHEVRGGWCLVQDDRCKTTVDGVWAVGEIGGIGGAEVAMAEGAVAAAAIAESLGGVADPGALAKVQARRQRERRAADAMLSAFAPLPGLAGLATADTVVCRCEDVRRADLERAASIHGPTVRAAKMGCRAGMGPCQGRICAPAVHGVFHGAGARPPCPVAQVPAKPVSIEVMLDAPAE